MRHIHRDWVCCLLLAENIASAHEHRTIVRPQAPRSHCERSLGVGALAHDAREAAIGDTAVRASVSYTHLTLPTNREV